MTNAQLELCTKKELGSATSLDSSRYSKADVVNFMWFKGAEYLFTDPLGMQQFMRKLTRSSLFRSYLCIERFH